MERWAANTLRGLAIAIIVMVVVPASLLLLLASMCSYSGGFEGHRDPGQGLLYLVGAIVLDIVAIIIIARLGRALLRSGPAAPAPPLISERHATPAGLTMAPVPAHLSPASQQALQNLIYAICAGIVLGAVFWANSIFHVARQFRGPNYPIQWLIMILLTAFLNYLPDFILLYRLRYKPNPSTLAFSMALPAASILRTCSTLTLTWAFLFRGGATLTYTLLPVLSGLVIEIVVLLLAWRANERLGYRHHVSSLLIAGVASYVYFMIFGSAATWAYRYIR